MEELNEKKVNEIIKKRLLQEGDTTYIALKYNSGYGLKNGYTLVCSLSLNSGADFTSTTSHAYTKAIKTSKNIYLVNEFEELKEKAAAKYYEIYHEYIDNLSIEELAKIANKPEEIEQAKQEFKEKRYLTSTIREALDSLIANDVTYTRTQCGASFCIAAAINTLESTKNDIILETIEDLRRKSYSIYNIAVDRMKTREAKKQASELIKNEYYKRFEAISRAISEAYKKDIKSLQVLDKRGRTVKVLTCQNTSNILKATYTSYCGAYLSVDGYKNKDVLIVDVKDITYRNKSILKDGKN